MAQSIDWHAFWARYEAAGRRMAERVARGAAEDLCQEAFSVVLERQRSGEVFASIEHARNYFFRVLHHRLVDVVRGRRLEELPESPAGGGRTPLEEASAREVAASREQLVERVKGAVDDLKAPERSALQLRFQEGLTFREMQERTGTSISTLQGRVESALIKLRKRIGKPALDP